MIIKNYKLKNKKHYIGVLINISILSSFLCSCSLSDLNIPGLHNSEPTTEVVTEAVTQEQTPTEAAKVIKTATATDSAFDKATPTKTEKKNPREDILIAIDPGHQSEDIDMSDTEPNGPDSSEMKTKAAEGTVGAYTDVPEYQLNLDISLKLRDELKKKGYKVIMTRENNETAISNMERACLANDAGADISIRIHANGSDDPSINGAMALVGSSSNPYVGELYDDSYKLAESVLDNYCETTGMYNEGVSTSDTMTGINWSTIPVMILEMGYMTNPDDDTNMQDPDYQEKMVEGIVNGIEAYYNLPENVSDDNISPKLSNNSRQIMDESLEYLEMLRSEGSLCSAYMKNLSTGETIKLSDGKQKAASIIKLFVAGAAYRNIDDLIKTGYSRSEIEELIKDMITISDNDACNELVTMLGGDDPDAGMSVVNKYISSFGYKTTRMGRLMLDFEAQNENYVEVSEVGDYLEKLYTGKNVEGADKIVSYMMQQEYTEKIPSVLPENVAVANKTGDLEDVESDAAIVYGETTDYIICVFTDKIEGTDTSSETIRNISEITYKYWE
ncbi:MAG: N-acetylmuramoyl-L-alanine amidase [Eubacterium sp.]|nr:N-acetylmuramoyl-L-alanine amidase [Eubacterium sp.]